MNRAAARAHQPEEGDEDEAWPPGVSRTPTMSIGAALSILQREFPAATVSKMRFLEDQGLVAPHRAPSGYRTYSQADVERLRFVLAAQRDSFLPLKVIRERLADLDQGTAQAPSPGARVVTEDGELVVAGGPERYTLEQLAGAAGITERHVGTLIEAGLVVADAGGRYPQSAVQVCELAADLAEHGVDVRHLRTLRTAAERQVDLVSQIVAPGMSHRTGPSSGSARAKAETMAADLAETFAQLHTAMVRAGVNRLI